MQDIKRRLDSMEKELSALYEAGLQVKYRYKSTHWYYMADLETAMRGVRNAKVRADKLTHLCAAMRPYGDTVAECMRAEVDPAHTLFRQLDDDVYHPFVPRSPLP